MWSFWRSKKKIKMKKLLNKLWEKTKSLFIWIYQQLKDVKTFVLFAIVFVIMAAGVWVPYLLAIITKNNYWWGIGSAVWLFWAGPLTPFIPLCITITLFIKKIYNNIKRRK